METNTHKIDTSNEYEDTKNRVCDASSKIKDGIKEIAGETKNIASLGQKVATQSMENGIDMVTEKSSEFMHALESSIKAKPVRAVAIAAGIGFMFAALRKRAS